MHLYDLVGFERSVMIASILGAAFAKGAAILLLGIMRKIERVPALLANN